MKLLLDHCVPRRLARHFPNHEVRLAIEMGWQELRNGRLLQAAADAGFEAMITTDRNIRFQQNLQRLPIAVVILKAVSNSPAALLPLVPKAEQALATLRKNELIEVVADPRI